MSFNTFTGSNWRASGGINRRKFGNFVNSDQITTGTLNIQNNLGFDGTKIPLNGNLAAINSNLLYQLEDNNENLSAAAIIYYPLNNFITDPTTGQLTNDEINFTVPPPIINETTNINVYSNNSTPSSTNTDLTFIDQSGNSNPYSFNSNYPGLITPQNAIQFRNNSNTLQLNQRYNTQNIYSNQNYEITAALNFTCRFYIYYDGTNHPEPFNILAFDTLGQDALINNSISSTSGQNTTGISNESLYISIPNANGTHTGSIYFTTFQKLGITGDVTQSSSIYKEFDITKYYNRWCTIEFSLGGTSIECFINSDTILSIPYVGSATFVPNEKIYINNGPYFPQHDTTTNTVIGVQNTTKYTQSPPNTSPIASLLAYKIGNFTIGTQGDALMFKNSLDEIVSEQYDPSLPNIDDKYINYVIGGGTNYLAQKLTLNNGLTNNGLTNNIGLCNNFGSSQFYGTSTFYGQVIIDSSLTLLVDSSNVQNFNIVTLPPAANSGDGSFTISNTALANSIDNPSMLVYNSTNGGQVKQQSGGGWSTTGLIFSISGENVSIGETFGSNKGLSVKGTVDISGNVDITGDISVSGDIISPSFIGDLNGTSVTVSEFVKVTSGYITAQTDISANGTIYAGNGFTTSSDIIASGNIRTTAASIIVDVGYIEANAGYIQGSSITSNNEINAGSDITATGSITATNGYITAGTTVTAGTDINATNSITAGTTVNATGSITTGSDIIASGNIRTTTGSIIVDVGSITATLGSITAGTTVTALSDVSLKENICNLEHSLENITKLRGIKHTRNDLPDKEKVYIGFIAQELEEIYPELVYTSEINGIKSVSYSNITPILVEAVKELKIITSKQQKIIDKLLSNLDISLNEM